MQSLRNNWVAIVFIFAVVASFVVGQQESKQRDEAQRTQLVAGCSRTSERSVLDAAYKQKTSDVRRAAGTPKDIVAADEYQKFSLGGVDLIPLPAEVREAMASGELHPQDALIRAVVESTNAAGDPIYRLTPEARAVVKQGCVEAYE